ncbi:MAG: 4Fe-4S dicluster domain-containing protein [Pseudomonadota bacterium]
MRRRSFLGALGAAGAALATGKARGSTAEPTAAREFVGVLCDTTRCIGCRACEVACAETHGLPVPDIKADGALETPRKTSFTQRTVVNRHHTDKGEVFVKRQCMHCWQPACTAACLTNAMLKTEDGPVVWRGDKCMGCRYCMVSCPFEMPKYEYGSNNPRINKCDLCVDRVAQGKLPACVEACPKNALQFGRKRDLMESAHKRIYTHPGSYVRHVYGEKEVGGTGWLYLASVPFDQLGFRTDLGDTPYPEYTKQFLYGVPVVFLVGPTLMLGLHQLTRRSDEVKKMEGQ